MCGIIFLYRNLFLYLENKLKIMETEMDQLLKLRAYFFSDAGCDLDKNERKGIWAYIQHLEDFLIKSKNSEYKKYMENVNWVE